MTEQCAARFACTVVNEVDLGTHILFVARVDDWAVLDLWFVAGLGMGTAGAALATTAAQRCV